jgi:hypothetical protein
LSALALTGIAIATLMAMGMIALTVGRSLRMERAVAHLTPDIDP